jgi:hypothetical protein
MMMSEMKQVSQQNKKMKMVKHTGILVEENEYP